MPNHWTVLDYRIATTSEFCRRQDYLRLKLWHELERTRHPRKAHATGLPAISADASLLRLAHSNTCAEMALCTTTGLNSLVTCNNCLLRTSSDDDPVGTAWRASTYADAPSPSVFLPPWPPFTSIYISSELANRTTGVTQALYQQTNTVLASASLPCLAWVFAWCLLALLDPGCSDSPLGTRDTNFPPQSQTLRTPALLRPRPLRPLRPRRTPPSSPGRNLSRPLRGRARPPAARLSRSVRPGTTPLPSRRWVARVMRDRRWQAGGSRPSSD